MNSFYNSLYRVIDDNLNKSSIKGSEAKKVREKVFETYPTLVPYMEIIWPEKAKVLKSKLKV